jgi:lysophospholipase L1-like esterase
MRTLVLCTVSLLLAGGPVLGDMMADSPVKFPDKGSLPAKYSPDVRTKGQAPEKDYYLFGTPQRSIAQIDKIQAEMPKGEFTAPLNDWAHLGRTRKALAEGGELHVLGLGDSIVNDTMRSAWLAKVQQMYPKARIRGTVYVRGGGGCQHYREEDRVAKHLVPLKPDLVFIGGISQKDIESVREVIKQIRQALPQTEFLLATGTFGTADPRSDAEMAKARHSGTGEWGKQLSALAAELKCGYLDMTTPWVQYIRSSKLHPHVFYRDRVHANESGEQILCKILTAYFSGADKK